jgi:hypothetical protein
LPDLTSSQEEQELILYPGKFVAGFVACVSYLQYGKVDRGNVIEPFDIELGSFDWLLICRHLQLIFGPNLLGCFEVDDERFAVDDAD